MSETLEERYEQITRRLKELDSNSTTFLFGIAITSLLDDLMAERAELKRELDLLLLSICGGAANE